MKSNLSVIISREFKERVAKKSFIITTILAPLLMIVMMAAPALIMEYSTPSDKKIAVIDSSGIVMPELQESSKGMDYLTIESTTLPLDSILKNENYDGVLVIGEDVAENPNNTTLYTHESSSLDMETSFNSIISKAVENERLRKYNIQDLNRILDEVKVDASLKTVRITDTGEEKDVSTGLSFGLGIIMTFILYMFLIMYGQMVMTSIIEEKNNRVLELVVSSVKPTQLMLGKIIGVGLVALFQILIWAVLICVMAGVIMPLLIPENIMQEVSSFNAGSYNPTTSMSDPELIQTVAMFTSVAYIAKLFIYMALFLIGGFFFYASIFAAIGSSVDNIQDASQLQTFALLPIILALIVAMSVGADPNSSLAVWMSMIPFTSPMVMLARIPFEIPTWQIWVSLAILVISFVFMAWFAGKIYRVGIFMYGKKPTIKDLIRWARYK